MNRPNILFVVLDATRADVCSCYGEEQPTTPALDSLAENGILFEQAISPAPWTLPALASVFTGLYPSQLGIYGSRALNDKHPTLAQVLEQSGYTTFGITSNSWLSAEFGLQRGLGSVHKQWQIWQDEHEVNKLVLLQKSQHSTWIDTVVRELSRGNIIKNLLNGAFHHLFAYRRDLGASRILRPLTRWIESQETPWFALIHYLEAHLEYKPPHRWADRFTSDRGRAKVWRSSDQWRAAWRHIAGVELLSEADLLTWQELYKAEVAYADYHLSLLLDWLRSTDRLHNTLVIVVADHGENLGEHRLLNHQYCVYDTLLRVPLVMSCPALLPVNERVPYQVQTLDLFKTVLDVIDVAAPASASMNMLAGSEARPFTVAEYGTPHPPHSRYLAQYGLEKKDLARFERGLTAIRTRTHKLIVGTDSSVELYAWPDDPFEEQDLTDQLPKLASELRATLGCWQEEIGATSTSALEGDMQMDPATAARLEALGYLG